MRYQTKQQLLDDIRTEHGLLAARLAEIPKARWQEAGVWGDAWTLTDLVAHLAEWQDLFLGWYEDGLLGKTPQLPAPGHKWNETPRLNRAIWEKHRSRSTSAVLAGFDRGYRRIVELVEGLSPEQLLAPGRFPWTGRHPLASYLGPNSASHYRFAIKVLRRWLKAPGPAPGAKPILEGRRGAEPGRSGRAFAPGAAQVPMGRSAKPGLLTGAAAERALRQFIAKFSPADQTRIRAARRLLHRQLAGAYELVYDNYNFLVLGYGPTARPSESVISLAAQANRLTLCFLRGARLPDPDGLLRGSGRQVRSVPLEAAADLDRPAIRRLVQDAFARAVTPLQRGPVHLIIRSVSARQRPRRMPGKRGDDGRGDGK